MLSNLRREMRYKDITNKDVAQLLGISTKTVSLKMHQVSEFTRSELFKLKELFPDKTYEYLFSDDETA